jgi:hypothetical protein
MKTSEDITELAKALSKAQATISDPGKVSENPHFKSRYADLHEILQAIRPAFSEHGLSVVQFPVATDPGRMGLETRIMHESGQWIEPEMTLSADLGNPKNVSHAMGSMITYMRRYSLAACAGIFQADDDGNAASEQAGYTAEQKNEFDDLLANAGAGEFFSYLAGLNSDTRSALHSSFPEGRKTELKRKAHDKEQEGSAMLIQIIEAIQEGLERDDEIMVKENWEDMAMVEKRYAWTQLNSEQRAYVKSLREE